MRATSPPRTVRHTFDHMLFWMGKIGAGRADADHPAGPAPLIAPEETGGR
jgi:hypothetical protein